MNQQFNVDQVAFMSAVDMKMANSLLGLGTAASSFPCPWCQQPKSTFDADPFGDMATFDNRLR